MENQIQEKILKGEEYSYFDKELIKIRRECKLKCFQYNCILKEKKAKRIYKINY